MLSWKEIKEMADYGITFGSHSLSHPHLTQLSYDEQKKEIQDGIQKLLTHNINPSTSVALFDYPYGDYNEDTVMILKEIGVKVAVTDKPGINDETTNPLELYRIGIDGFDDLPHFKKKLAGAFDWLYWWHH
jgi:peptidoglycan/xylan/chitin deacetylase (PgdA/CDA1 family)